MKRTKIHQYERLSKTKVDKEAKKRRTDRAGKLVEKFERNPKMLPELFFKIEKMFCLLIHFIDRFYLRGEVSEFPEDLFYKSQGQLRI